MDDLEIFGLKAAACSREEVEVHNALIIRLVLGGRPNKGAQQVPWYCEGTGTVNCI